VEAGAGCYCEVGGVEMNDRDIRIPSLMLMVSSFATIPFLLMAAYNFHMAKVVQHHPLAQQMLTTTVLIMGMVVVFGLVGFLMFVFSKEIAGKFKSVEVVT
jgi:hypothetical protein